MFHPKFMSSPYIHIHRKVVMFSVLYPQDSHGALSSHLGMITLQFTSSSFSSNTIIISLFFSVRVVGDDMSDNAIR